MSWPERLGQLLPGVLADLAARHGITPPTTLTNRSSTMPDLICDFCGEPMDNTTEGPRASGIAICADCAALGEPDEDGAA